MSKFIGFNSEDLTNFKNQGGTPVSSKLIFTGEKGGVGDTVTLFDAVNISWKGYKLGEDLTYTGDVLSYIQSSYSYLVTELGKKISTSDSGIWDDINNMLNNSYITSQISIYTSSNSKTAPAIEWGESIETAYDGVTSYSSLPNNWAKTIDGFAEGLYVFMSSIYEVKSFSHETLGFHGPSSKPIYLPGEDGLNGNFKSTVFVRSNITPDTPANGANYYSGMPLEKYAYVENSAPHTNIDIISYNNGTEFKCWSDGIPAGQEKLWATTSVISNSHPENSTWTTPRQMTDTETYDVEFSDNVNIIPTDSSWDPTHYPSIWYDPTNDPQFDFSTAIWRAERVCNNGEWGNWVIIKIKGEQGDVGPRGDFKSTVYTRSESTPIRPTGGTYNSPIPTDLDEDDELIWSDGIPSGTGPIWSSWRTFSALDNSGEWTNPQLVADTPTYDVEFSDNVNIIPTNSSWDPTNNPSIWHDPITDQQFDFSTAIWRAERTRATIQDSWSSWVITKIKGEDGKIGKPAQYFEQRWCLTENTGIPNTPPNDMVVGGTNNNWALTPQYETGKYTWLTARKVDYTFNSSTNSWAAVWADNSSWSIPMRMNGIDGIANPIQPVLKYQWYNSNVNAPSYIFSNQNPGSDWKESPGNPQNDNIYLWMIQGYRHNSAMTLWDTDDDSNTPSAYWSNAVCLSGKDGEPGADGDDIEFIYKRFESAHSFTTDNPSSWYTTASIDKSVEEWTGSGKNNIYSYVNDYLGPVGDGWSDNPQGVDSTYKFEYATYRKTHKVNGESYWEAFNSPFAWSIYGENGIDGDGVEYIYWAGNLNAYTNPPAFNLDPSSFQQSEVVGTWNDDPQNVNNTNQKYQYVSTRKFREVTNDNLSKIPVEYRNDIEIGDKIWFPYSKPELWNWYVEDGTNADRIVMLYKRTSSSTSYYGMLDPDIDNSNSYIIPNNGWKETPGNNEGPNTAYLWMTSNYYSNKKHTGTDTIYTVSSDWQTPVCLTGEPGHDGEDGADIEFIYLRTSEDDIVPTLTLPNAWWNTNSDYQESDWPFINADYNTSANGIKFINGTYISGHPGSFNSGTSEEIISNVWTDNPLGVNSTYDYEYAAVRRKQAGTNSAWGKFSPVFLWSKFGEDGVDGDGVEYIFYLSSDESETSFDTLSQNDNNSSNNPANWAIDQNPEYIPDGFIWDKDNYPNADNVWTDDPRGISEERRWEYVSVRHKRLNSTTGNVEWGKYSEPSLWSHFAVDALATNLVLESDNDMMAVSIDDLDVVTASVASQATFRLDHNTKTVDTSYYSMYINNSNVSGDIVGFESDYSYLKINVNGTLQTFAKLQLVNSSYVLTTTIPEGFDMTDIENELRITSYAEVTDNSFDNTGNVELGTQRIFTNKVNGLHLTIDDIYQIQVNKTVIKSDPNNDLEKIRISLKSLTSNDRIDNQYDALTKHLYVFYDNYKCTTLGNNATFGSYLIPIGKELILRDDPTVIEHKFSLYYDSNDTYTIENVGESNTQSGTNSAPQTLQGTLLDEETVQRVFDGEQGNPGIDSKSQEFIYFVTDDLSYFENSAHNIYNPELWNPDSAWNINGISYYAYNTDDFPFVNGLSSYYGWEDTQIGISEELPYQFTSSRSYNTSTQRWSSFSTPVCTHNWGHSGEDGDGVEYIYYRTNANNKHFYNDENPKNWYGYYNYQTSEYIKENQKSNWKDNPQGVAENNRYEYVSIRKYKYKEITNETLYTLLDEFAISDNGGQDIYKNIVEIINNVIEYNQNEFYNDNLQLEQGIYNVLTILNLLYNGNDVNKYGIFDNISDLIYKCNQYIVNTWGSLYNTSFDYSSLTRFCEKYLSGNLEYIFVNSHLDSYEEYNYSVINYITDKSIKEWGPYSYPKLWAKYGETGAQGPAGPSGGSGLTLDFDNPSIQIAVNSNGYIKDNQTVTTYLNVLSGATHISSSNIILSFNTPIPTNAFTHSYSSSDKFGHKIYNGSDCTYYTWMIGDIDTDNNGTPDSNAQLLKLESNSNIEFAITYNNSETPYIKHVNLIPIQYGEDGADAETFELYCAYSTLHYNRMLDTAALEPNSIQYKIKHVTGNSVSIDDVSNAYVLTYSLIYNNSTINNVSPNDPGDVKPSGDEGRIDPSNPIADTGKGGKTVTEYTATNGVIPVNTFSNLDNLKQINVTLKYQNDVWDEDILEVIYDGINGVDGNSIEYIYYCPEGIDQISWTAYTNGSNNDNGNINPAYWAPNNSSDYRPDAFMNIWTDHPTGVDSTHMWEYISQREYDGESETWGRYSNPTPWSHYGEEGKDGDGVEYIYHLNNSEIFDGQNPEFWTSDADFQNTEYISSYFTFDPSANEAWNSYIDKYLTFTAKSQCDFKLTIPPSIWANDSYFEYISYKINNSAWQTPNQPDSKSSNFIINISADIGDTIQWRGKVNTFAYLPSFGANFSTSDPSAPNYYVNDKEYETAAYFSSYNAGSRDNIGQYEISGNIMSLLDKDNFVSKTSFDLDYTFMYLFGKYSINNSTWGNRITDISNLVLPATELSNGCYRYMFSKNKELGYCNIILPARVPKSRCYESMFADCTNLDGNIYIYSEGGSTSNSLVWAYRMMANTTKPLNVYLYLNYIRLVYINNGTVQGYRCEDFNYFLQNNNISAGKIIQHGLIDIEQVRDENVNPFSGMFGAVNFSFITPPSWTDNPSGVSETYKYEWVSTRKYKEVTEDDTELTNAGLNVGDKAWHPYSEPSIWAKYGEQGPVGPEGESAPKVVMLYKRTASMASTLYPPKILNDQNINYSYIVNSDTTYSWMQSPGNHTNDNDAYLWMTSNYYTSYDTELGRYVITDFWTTPACLTGEPGHEGKDGSDIEFIYNRNSTGIIPTLPAYNINSENYQNNDWPFIDNNYHVIEGIKTLNERNYDTWSDNPFGVTSNYSYEYAAIRRKPSGINSQWEGFGKVFLWAKYGEDGVDGDGVEYIYSLTNSPGITDNPSDWFTRDSSYLNNYQEDEFIPQNSRYDSDNIGGGGRVGEQYGKWSDDPREVTSDAPYQYVSVRKYKAITESNCRNIPNWNSSTQSVTFGSKTYKIGDYIWWGYSDPKLWAKYGKDGEASAVTMDNNNENVAAIIDDHERVINAVDELAVFNMYDNLQEVSFSMTGPSSPLFSYTNGASNSPCSYWKSGNSYVARFKFIHDQEIPGGRTTYTFTGKYIKDSEEIVRSTNVRILGIKQSDVPILYQLRPTANVVKWDGVSSYIPNKIFSYISYIENGENKIITSYGSSKFSNDKLQLYINDRIQDSLEYKVRNSVDFPLNIELKYGTNSVLLDSENINMISDGKKGDAGAASYVLDWTNDQINLAVDAEGYILPGQVKETSINIGSLNGVFGNNPTITMKWYTNGDEMPYKKFTKNYSEGGSNTINSNTIAAGTSPNSNQISFSHGNNSYPLKITVGQTYPSNKAYIPENGIEIKIQVTISGNGKTISNVDKILRVCGQHIAQDGQNGQNAITYELNISPNVLSNPSTTGTTNINVAVIKYEGNTQTSLSNLPTDFALKYYKNNASSSLINVTLWSNPITLVSTTKSLTFKLYNSTTTFNDTTCIDTETIPIVRDGSQGAKGNQGFTGPVVRYCGEWKASNNGGPSKYYNGCIKPNATSVPNLYYKDIVTHAGQYYTPTTSSADSSTLSYDTAEGEFENIGYIFNSTTWVSGKWVEATQFDFVATRLLYADQGLVNQLSTHDLIVTNSTGYPVAGVTSGRTAMTDSNGNPINSPLQENLGSSWSGNSPVGNYNTDPVRIFAGQIYDEDENDYNLCYAPFKVTESGTAYMTKAIIEGDITAKSLMLGELTFIDATNTNNEPPELNMIDTGQNYRTYGINEQIWWFYPYGNNSRYDIQLNKIFGNNAKIKTYYILTGDSSNSIAHLSGLKYNGNNYYNIHLVENAKTSYHDDGTYEWYILPPNHLIQLIGIGTIINVVEIPLAPEKPINNITINPEYYDITEDVELICYNYSDGGWYISDTNSTYIPKISFFNEGNNSQYMTIDFYTYMTIDPTIGNYYCGYANFNRLFGWFSNSV